MATDDTRLALGTLVRDTRHGRVGEVVDFLGDLDQVRPQGGGCEWDAMPENLEAVDRAVELSARVAEVNRRSRTGL